MNGNKLKKNLLATSVLAGVAIGISMTAAAQDAVEVVTGGEADRTLETITVTTGSRLSNPNLSSSSPITSVGQEEFSLSNAVNAEQFLNTLPQVVPGFDSSSNNPGTGEATIDLRGLGSNRTLVLVNGRRYVTSNQAAGQVDLNTIPAALIENVDILTGGASAIYGSDAISGVVNFQLKNDFEGLQATAGYEITQEGDGEIFTASTTFGGNFDNDRGNAAISLEYTNRQSVLQGDREEAFFTLNDGGADVGFLESGSVNVPGTFGLDFGTIDFTQSNGIDPTGGDFTATNVAIPDGAVLPTCGAEGTTVSLDVVRDGAGNPVLDANGDQIQALRPSNFTGNAFCSTDTFGFLFNPNGDGIIPFINDGPNTNRYNYAPVNFLQLPQDRYSIYATTTYDITDQIEAYGQAVYVNSQTQQLLAPTPAFEDVTVNFDNPFLDAGTVTALENISNGTDSDGDGVNDIVLSTGRRFEELGGRVSSIRNDSFQIQGGLRGNLSDTWNYDVFGSFGQAASSISQTGNINVPAYQAAVAEGRANIFEAGGLTQDIVDEISVTGIISGQNEQTIISGLVDGTIFDWASPAAETPISVGLGVEYRQERLTTFGAGLGPDVAGFNQAPDISGSFDVYEIFGEINAPLIENKPFVEDLSFTGALRLSDYSTVGGVESYAAGLAWTPIEGLRLRGQYQRAVRAPNIGELFSPQTNGFPGLNDPCSGGQFGGFDDLDAATQAIVTANCEGNAAHQVPVGAAGTPLQVNQQVEGLFGGNPNLSEETADTFTIGATWEPTFIDNLTLSVDYFDIAIEDVVAGVPSQRIFDFCFVDNLQNFCNAIRRTPSGTVDTFDSFSQNAAELSTSGIDFTFDYSYDTDAYGTFGLYSLVTWLDSREFIPLPGEDPIEFVGFFGNLTGTPTPEWNMNTRVDWSKGPFGARVRWTLISEVEDDLFANGGTPDLFVENVDPYHQVDLTTFYDFNDHYSLTFGIENVFNTDYVLIGDASAEQSNTFPASFDTLGRTFFLRLAANF